MLKSKLLIGNISTDADEAYIRKLFSVTAGIVSSVSLPLDARTGKNRGYALVEMNSEVEAQQAVRDLHGTSLGGRSMCVSLVERAIEKKKWYKFGA